MAQPLVRYLHKDCYGGSLPIVKVQTPVNADSVHQLQRVHLWS